RLRNVLDQNGQIVSRVHASPVHYYNPTSNATVYLTIDGTRYRFIEQAGEFVADQPHGATAVLTRYSEGDIQWKVRRKNGDRLFFLANGALKRKEFASGGTLTYQYDADGRLIAKQDHLGRSLSYSYDEYNRLVAVT